MHKLFYAFTLVEMLVVIAILSVLSMLLLPSLVTAVHTAKSVSCLNQEKQMGISFNVYQENYSGFFPIINRGGGWYQQIRWPALLLTYGSINDSTLLKCPEFEGEFTEIGYAGDLYNAGGGLITTAKICYQIHQGKGQVYAVQGPLCSCSSGTPGHRHSGTTDGFRPSALIRSPSREFFYVDSFDTKSSYSGSDGGNYEQHLSLVGGPYNDFLKTSSGQILGNGQGSLYGPNNTGIRSFTSTRHNYGCSALYWDGHVSWVSAEVLWTDSAGGTNPECYWDGY